MPIPPLYTIIIIIMLSKCKVITKNTGNALINVVFELSQSLKHKLGGV